MGVLCRHLRHSTLVEVLYLRLHREIFYEAIYPHISFISVKGEKVMFITGLYNYVLKSPVGEYISVQSVDGVFDVLKEHQGYEFVSKTLIAYQSCAMAD